MSGFVESCIEEEKSLKNEEEKFFSKGIIAPASYGFESSMIGNALSTFEKETSVHSQDGLPRIWKCFGGGFRGMMKDIIFNYITPLSALLLTLDIFVYHSKQIIAYPFGHSDR